MPACLTCAAPLVLGADRCGACGVTQRRQASATARGKVSPIATWTLAAAPLTYAIYVAWLFGIGTATPPQVAYGIPAAYLLFAGALAWSLKAGKVSLWRAAMLACIVGGAFSIFASFAMRPTLETTAPAFYPWARAALVFVTLHPPFCLLSTGDLAFSRWKAGRTP